MELSQDLETSSELSFSASEEFKQYQSQRLLHIDALSAKIDQVLTHQHELLALIRHASKSNFCFPVANERELRSVEHNLAKDSAPHVSYNYLYFSGVYTRDALSQDILAERTFSQLYSKTRFPQFGSFCKPSELNTFADVNAIAFIFILMQNYLNAIAFKF